ncbi:MAG: hypothetical protein J6B50_10135 [Lachnospiraceae bacterium]|nr:hypothetical protein [Lachnospiraceae bacterium]
MYELNGTWDWKSDEYGDDSSAHKAPFISVRSDKRSDEYRLYWALDEAYGAAEGTDNIITYISIYNNPYIQ